MKRFYQVLAVAGVAVAVGIALASKSLSGAAELVVRGEKSAPEGDNARVMRNAQLDAQLSAIVKSTMSREEKLRTLFDRLRSSRDDIERRYVLEAIGVLRPRGKELDSLYDIVQSTSASDVFKIGAMRVISASFVLPPRQGLFNPSAEDLAGNEKILGMLRDSTGSGSQEVSREALMTFSRLGDSKEAVSLLSNAVQQGKLTQSEFSQEVVVNLPSLPGDMAANQVSNIIRMADSGAPGSNKTVSTLFAMYENSEVFQRASEATKNSLNDALRWAEARSPGADLRGASVDVVDLEARRLVLAGRTKSDSDSQLASHIYGQVVLNLDVSPATVLAALVSSYGSDVAKLVVENRQLDLVQARLDAVRYDQGSAVEMAMNEARSRLRRAK
jgi:hypothetical protein